MRPLIHHLRSHPTFYTLSATTAAIASLTLLTSTRNAPAKRLLSSTSSKMTSHTGTSASAAFPVRPYTPRNPDGPFPYSTSDLTPMDAGGDVDFYASPRFVTHIDDHAIGLLRRYYGSILPVSGILGTAGATAQTVQSARSRPRVLDLCSSWISHYPTSVEAAAKSGEDMGIDIAGLGMNARELGANPLFGSNGAQARWMVKDLNAEPTIPPLDEVFGTTPASAIESASGSASASDLSAEGGTEVLLDTTTLTVSIDYLTSPLKLLKSLRERTKVGGTVHMSISNRCFPTKAVGRWLKISEGDRLAMVGDYLWWSGWREIEIVELSNGVLEGEQDQRRNEGIGKFMAMMGLPGGGTCDPLWIVRARKVDERDSGAGAPAAAK